jgi:hypothetical protein
VLAAFAATLAPTLVTGGLPGWITALAPGLATAPANGTAFALFLGMSALILLLVWGLGTLWLRGRQRQSVGR